MKIKDISGYQVYDSRGNPTVEAQVVLEDGSSGRGTVPSGASRGQYEAWELRDKDNPRFQGNSVLQAVENIQVVLKPALIQQGGLDQKKLDAEMIALDGTPNKSRLGANAILAVSMAFAHACANSRRVPLYASLGGGTLLPLPEIQIMGGGAHANRCIDVQDFMIVATGATSYEQALEITHDVYRSTRNLLERQGKLRGVADEGGFWPEVTSNEEAFEIILAGIECAGYKPGVDVAFSLDIAASDLYDEHTGRYQFHSEGQSFDTAGFIVILLDWCKKYPIVSIEDPLADADWEGWKAFRSTAPSGLQIIADDLFCTNSKLIKTGIESDLANAVLIKLNQIGTVSETLDAIALTQSANWNPVISARSGETEDAFIAHLAVATNAGQLKVGSFSRSERMVKWNEVLRIGRELGSQAVFRGAGLLPSHEQASGTRVCA